MNTISTESLVTESLAVLLVLVLISGFLGFSILSMTKPWLVTLQGRHIHDGGSMWAGDSADIFTLLPAQSPAYWWPLTCIVQQGGYLRDGCHGHDAGSQVQTWVKDHKHVSH